LENIYIIIPAFNEEKNIFEVIKSVQKYYNNILVINDCSTDNTSKIAKQTNVQVIDLPINKGVGHATRVGCDLAIKLGADILVTLDADGQHSAEDIPNLVEKMKFTKVDIVFGYRIPDQSMPFEKKIGNKLLIILNKMVFGITLKDSLTGFHVFNSNSFDKIRWESNRYSFITELAFRIYKEGLKFEEVKVKTLYLEKKKGMSIKDGIKSIALIFIWRYNLSRYFIKLFKLS